MRSSLRRHTPSLLRNVSRTSRAEGTTPRALPAAPAPAPITRPTTRASQQQRWHTSSSSSVNADEISHFNALASTWWDPHGSSRALHLMNPLRHDFINACRSSSPSSSSSTTTITTDTQQRQQKLRYLDVGCGGGIFAESAARLPSTHSVTAIDAAPVIIQVARQHAAKDPLLTESKLRYINTTIENLPSTLSSSSSSSSHPQNEPSQFDIVTLFEVIEHVDSPSTFLSHLSQHVKPGGWLILSTIARTWTSWFTTNFMAEDVLGIVPKGTHDWNKYINEDELRGYFAKVADDQKWDLSSLKVQGVVYVPGLGWKEVGGSEKVGNYFLGIQKRL